LDCLGYPIPNVVIQWLTLKPSGLPFACRTPNIIVPVIASQSSYNAV